MPLNKETILKPLFKVYFRLVFKLSSEEGDYFEAKSSGINKDL